MNGGIALRGRDAESAALDRLLDAARSGESGALVVRGEPGIGKTALLDYAIDSAPDLRLLRAVGVQSEIELAFAGLHQLCAPLLDRLDRLPDPQRQAMRVAFGISDGEAPDRFVVGLAALSLLSDAADEQPLLCAVDDAQWLDEESALTLAFVARRLFAESVAIVFVTRERSEVLRGLPELVLDGLDADDARSLLASGLPGLVDEQIRDRIVAETRGNPLALLELPHGLSAVELAGGFGLPDDVPLTDRIEQSFLRRLESLRGETRRLLLAAAAEPVGDVTVLWRAAERLELGPEAAEPAQTAGLIEFGGRVRFRHPLVRSAIYRAATLPERRQVHQALADATDPAADPDRRAWHLAQAAGGPDEEVASELERSADRARARGGVAAMAAFLERAAELTPDPARRGARALAAAQAKLEAGSPEAAQALLATAELTPLDELQRARLQRLRAQIAFARRGSDAPALLLEAAERLVPLDPGLARETCLEALAARIFFGTLGGGRDVQRIVRAALPASPPAAVDLLLNGLATRAAEGYAAGAAPLREALDAFRQGDDGDPGNERWLWLACRVAADLWEHEAWEELASSGVRRARESGALSVLPMVSSYRAGVHLHAGEYAQASALLEEASAVTQATHATPLVQAKQMVAAYRGEEATALELIKAGRRSATARGQGMALSMIECANAILLQRPRPLRRGPGPGAARVRATTSCPCTGWPWSSWSRRPRGATIRRSPRRRLERLSERTRASGTDWALGLEARSRAFVTDGPAAGDLYEEAVERLGRGRLAPHRARAQLVYGEWLRREKRRLDARDQLRAAHDTFTGIGAKAFAERARRELQATGETARKRSAATRDDLTPQEAQIARLARDGLSNPEIGARLFISPRTVQYHLHKVFAKLDISSRNQLGRVLTSKQD